jgi:hypothetical protein
MPQFCKDCQYHKWILHFFHVCKMVEGFAILKIAQLSIPNSCPLYRYEKPVVYDYAERKFMNGLREGESFLL